MSLRKRPDAKEYSRCTSKRCTFDGAELVPLVGRVFLDDEAGARLDADLVDEGAEAADQQAAQRLQNLKLVHEQTLRQRRQAALQFVTEVLQKQNETKQKRTQ